MNKDNLYISSDLHLFHRNICKGVSSWEDTSGCRDFNSIEDMNQTIINGINKTVEYDDHLFLLGDHLFGKDKDYAALCDKIVCDNIFLMMGNHCRYENLIKQENFTFIGHYKEMKVGKRILVMSHYPILSFNHMNRGAYHLYGHCHAGIHKSDHQVHKYYRSLRTLDVGIDNAFHLFGEYRPFSFSEIEDYMKDKDNRNNLDHH